jgi:hypothetical protein
MIEAAIHRVIEQAPPAQRAVLERVEQPGPEKALAMLNSGTSDFAGGNGQQPAAAGMALQNCGHASRTESRCNESGQGLI